MTMPSHVAAVRHPAPHRARVRLPLLLFGLGGAPAAWLAQTSANYAFAAQACFVAGARQTVAAPGPHVPHTVLWLINLGTVGVALACAAISYRHWRATRGEVAGAPAHHHHLLDVGEGRTRFLALCGLLAALTFLAATLFGTVGLVVVPPCPG